MNNQFKASCKVGRPDDGITVRVKDSSTLYVVGLDRDLATHTFVSHQDADRLTDFLVFHGYGTQKATAPAEEPVETIATSKDIADLRQRIEDLWASLARNADKHADLCNKLEGTFPFFES